MTWTDEMLGEDNAEVLALERKIAAMQALLGYSADKVQGFLDRMVRNG